MPPPIRPHFRARLAERAIPLDPAAVCRLIRACRQAWAGPGARYRKMVIRCGRLPRGRAIVVWDAELDTPVTAYWRGGSPPPPKRRRRAR